MTLCLFCAQPFVPSAFRPHQRVCGQPDCQRRRRKDYHQRKIQTDPEYRQVCLESQQKWRTHHLDYPQRYRENHPEWVQHNRQRQHFRDQKRRLGHLVKNNLAFSKILIFETVTASAVLP